MNYNAKIRETLNKYLFLEVKSEKLLEYLKIHNNKNEYEDTLLLPINSGNIVENKSIYDYIPVSYFVEGMFYVLGADNSFRYKNIYISLLSSSENSIRYIKSKIAEEYKKGKLEEAFIYLRGLLLVSKEEDIFLQALRVGEAIREKNQYFKEPQLQLIEEYKEDFSSSYPYLVEGLIAYNEGDLQLANVKLHNYLAQGGETSEGLNEILEAIEEALDYRKALDIMAKKPEESLKILLKKAENETSASLLYYISVAYRNLKLHE